MPQDGKKVGTMTKALSNPLEVWGYADLVLDLTPATGRMWLIAETPQLEAVLGKTHRAEF